LLGINTHINLDLAIAAADCCPADKIHSLQSDFEKINSVIAILTQSVQDTLASIWLPMKAINRITDKQQDAVINFSINTARRISWRNALTLAGLNEDARKIHIERMDSDVVWVANRVKNPGFFLSISLSIIRIREPKSVSSIIEILQK
jgi:hypothetical protein